MEADKAIIAESVIYNDTTDNSSHAKSVAVGELAQTEVTAHQPGQFKVIRRNSKVTVFDACKINVALTKAFLNLEGGTAASSTRIHEKVNELTEQVVRGVTRSMPGGGTIHIEDIQDYVELALMRAGEQKAAHAYVIYREDRARERAEKTRSKPEDTTHTKEVINVTHVDGSLKPLDMQRFISIINEACLDLENVEGHLIIDDAYRNLFDGVKETDVNHALVMSARALVEKEPNYSYVAARLLLDNLRREALSYIEETTTEATQAEVIDRYPPYFSKYINKCAELGLLDHELVKYDLDRLGKALKPERESSVYLPRATDTL